MRYLLLPCQRFCVIHVHHPTSNVSLLSLLLRLVHNQVNTKGPVNYTHVSKVTYCVVIISSNNLFYIIRYLNSLLRVAELLLRSLVKKLPCCLWLPKSPHHVRKMSVCHRKDWQQSVSALSYFSKICFIVVTPVIPVSLKVYQTFCFFVFRISTTLAA